MNTLSKIAIIVPFYNVEKYFDKCLNCLMSQTLRDIEIILVDDCGIDGSAEIAWKYAALDNRIKIVKMPENGGRSRARNFGISVSTAPYIMFCDSDDSFHETMCEKMLNAIESSNADMAMCGIAVEYEDGLDFLQKSDSEYYCIRFSGLRKITYEALRKTDVSVCNKIFRRDILIRCNILFPEGLKYEDAYFFTVYSLQSETIFYLTESLYRYNRHLNGSVMGETFSGTSGVSIDHLKIGIEICTYLKNSNLFLRHSQYAMELFFSYCQFSLNHEKSESGKTSIYRLAKYFIDHEGWKSMHLSKNIARQIKLIESEALFGNSVRKRFFGVITIKESYDRCYAYLFGIRIWKIKYSNTKTKHYLLGFLRVP